MKRDIEAFDVYLTGLFEKRGYPGMAVTIRGPEGILFQKGYGFRDIKNSLPADENTVFGVASMSKSMTALACAILHTEGSLDLEDPVVKYFPDFHIPGIPDECVTLRTLAMHRAGIPPMEPMEWSIAMNSVEMESYWYRHMRETAPNKMDEIGQIVDYISQGNYEPLGMPGEYMSYCNEGYAILSYVVDQAAQMPLERFLEKRIFRPLGMTRTVQDLDGSEAIKLAKGNISSIFVREEDGGFWQDENWSVLPPYRGCACVKSTSADMSKYYKTLCDGGVWEGQQVIQKEAVELLIGRGYPASTEPYYCLGLEKKLINGRVVCDHSGALRGVSSCGALIEGGYSVAVLCNEGEQNMDEFKWACYNYVLGLPYETQHYWAWPSGGVFSMPEILFGDYLSREGLPQHCIVELADGKLTGSFNGEPVDFLYCQKTVFAAVSREDHKKRISTVEFYIRDGKTWAARCGTRIFQRTGKTCNKQNLMA